MPLPVSLPDVVNEMEVFGDESYAYLNKRTGELVTLNQEELNAAEEGEDLDDYPDWEQAMIEKAKEVVASDDYLPLPDRFEIHEYSIMERFCLSIEDDERRDLLLIAIRGSGAFGRFKDAVHRLNIADDWHRFRNKALERIAAGWLEVHEIAYTKS